MSTDTQNNEFLPVSGDTSYMTDGDVGRLIGVPGQVANIRTDDPTNIVVSTVGTNDPSEIPMPEFTLNAGNKKHMATVEAQIEKALAPPKPGAKPIALSPAERVSLGQILNAVRSGKATNHTFKLLTGVANKYPGLIPAQTMQALRMTPRPQGVQTSPSSQTPTNTYIRKDSYTADALANIVEGKDNVDRVRAAQADQNAGKTEQLGDTQKGKHDYTQIKVSAAYLTPLYADQFSDEPKPSANSDKKPEDEAKEAAAKSKLQTADENGSPRPRAQTKQWYGTVYAASMAPHPTDG